MDKNHLKTRRKGEVVKGADPIHMAGQGCHMPVGAFPWKKKIQNHKLVSQAQSTGISWPRSIQWRKATCFFSAEETNKWLEKKPPFLLTLKGAKIQVLFLQLFTLGPRKGKTMQLKSSEECLEWEALGRDRGEAVGFSVLAYTWILQ